jgi:hypothetical protein
VAKVHGDRNGSNGRNLVDDTAIGESAARSGRLRSRRAG